MCRTKDIWISLKSPLMFASPGNLLKPYATNKNNKGESEKPYLRPRYEGKKGEASPFINISKDTIDIQLITHLIKSILKPR